MEDGSYQIIKSSLPSEWVIREFNRPDYGIDLVIELFEIVDEGKQIAETLGEFLFVQVKSVESLEQKKKRIYPVQNVAKGYWSETKDEYINLDIVNYSLDTDTILTIQQLGGSVVVLLFLVDLSSSETYFVCLNDYIDKIILPKHPNYTDQDSYTINIPILNKLSDDEIALQAMRFYGKRAKLLSAFSKFYYQKNEILHLFDMLDFPVLTLRHELEAELTTTDFQIIAQLKYFINQLEYLDIWTTDFWILTQECFFELQLLKEYMDRPDINMDYLKATASFAWKRLSNMGNVFEEVCREWYLPKFISMLCSYPKMPEIVKLVEKP